MPAWKLWLPPMAWWRFFTLMSVLYATGGCACLAGAITDPIPGDGGFILVAVLFTASLGSAVMSICSRPGRRR